MRMLSGEPPATMREGLRALADSPHADGAQDVYGTGLVATLESRVAGLLGKDAALWFPTGTMAQQAILRVWAERSGVSGVAVHPRHHTQVHEEGALTVLSGLDPVVLTAERRHPTAGELRAWPTPLAAAVFELPLQEFGYVLPTWDEYIAFSDATRERGVPLHVDGARLWEAQHGLGHPLAEIAARASSVYVSLYKGLGGTSGAVLAADADVVAEAQVWRTRYGGNVFRQFPAIIAALDGLDARLARIPEWHRQAAVVAEGLRRLPELRVTPDPPHICEFFVATDLPADALDAAVATHAAATGERWLHGWWSSESGETLAEMTVRDPALAWTADDVERVGRAVLDGCAPRPADDRESAARMT